MSHSATLPILLKQLKLSTMAALWENYLGKHSTNHTRR